MRARLIRSPTWNQQCLLMMRKTNFVSRPESSSGGYGSLCQGRHARRHHLEACQLWSQKFKSRGQVYYNKFTVSLTKKGGTSVIYTVVVDNAMLAPPGSLTPRGIVLRSRRSRHSPSSISRECRTGFPAVDVRDGVGSSDA